MAAFPRQTIKIKSTPPGEAPLWVRESWVGLSLPLAQKQSRARRFLAGGVLTGPSGWMASLSALFAGKLRWEVGYAVHPHEAIAILEAHSPDAAAWWKEHASLIHESSRFFVFQEGVAVVEESIDK